MIFFEYAEDVAAACHARGVKTVAVTAGYMCPEPRAEFFRCIDAANVDLKGFTEDFYRRLTASHLAPVLDTLQYLRRETDVWLEITTLLIPGENDSAEEIDAMTRWIARGVGAGRSPAFLRLPSGLPHAEHPPTPKATLRSRPRAGDRQRPASRLRRQLPRSAGRDDVLRRLRRRADRARQL